MSAILIVAAIGFGVWLTSRRVARAERTVTPEPASRPALPGVSTKRAPTRDAGGPPAEWTPLGGDAQAAGLSLGGGVYVGESLRSVNIYRGPDPALINPRLPVNLRRPDIAGSRMSYWPSYSAIPAESRGAYLRWLAGGRAAGAYIGYVFLFFYGIERRVILDAQRDEQAREEVPQLLAEVQRLLDLYAENRSFHGYASGLLAMSRLAGTQVKVADLEPPGARGGWELPLEVKLAAGAFAADGEPLPGPWALSWLLNSPSHPLRTPARRCEKEFAELFLAGYQQRYGDGIRLKPGRAKLHLEYRPASASFGGAVQIDCGGLPDVTNQPALTTKLADIADEATEQLDRYSRYLGRHGDATSPLALALLPPQLAASRLPSDLESLIEGLTTTPTPVPSERLATLVPTSQPKPSKTDAAALAAVFAVRGVALEPDVRYGTTNFLRQRAVVLWKDHEAAQAPDERFSASTVLMHLGVAVSASDGEISAPEQGQLETRLIDAFALEPASRRRLEAHLRWLLTEQPGIAGLKARIAQITESQRRMIAQLLLTVAAADGRIAPQEIKSLRRLYELLGLDPELVHGELHTLAAGPVTIISGEQSQGDRTVPGPPTLDEKRLRDVQNSTRQVHAVLSSVFAQEIEPEEEDESPTSDDPAPGQAGLDRQHAVLLQRLATRQSWTRSEFDEAAAELGLLPGGALETLNEAAFSLAEAPLLEDEDPLELDGHVLKAMLG